MESKNIFKPAGLLIFSVNITDLESSFIEAALDLFLKSINPNLTPVVLVADTLRSEVLQPDKSPQINFKKCMEIGNKYKIKIFNYLLKNKLNIDILKWDDLVVEEDYQTYTTKLLLEFEKNRTSCDKFVELSCKHLKLRSPNRIWKQKDIDAGVRFYLKEAHTQTQDFKIQSYTVKNIFYPNRDCEKFKELAHNLYTWTESICAREKGEMDVIPLLIENNSPPEFSLTDRSPEFSLTDRSPEFSLTDRSPEFSLTDRGTELSGTEGNNEVD
jgi:hypothetical protein